MPVSTVVKRTNWKDVKPSRIPHVNFNTTLARNLVYCSLFEKDGTKDLDLVYGLGGTKTALTSVINADRKYGKGYRFNGSTSVIDLGLESRTVFDTSGNLFSAVFLVNYDGNGGSLLSKRDGGDVEFQAFLFNNSGTHELRFRRGATFQTIYSGLPSSGPMVIGFSYNTSACTGYFNGQKGTTQSGYPNPTFSTINVAVGARWNTYPASSANSSSDFHGGFMWNNRQLTDEEHQEIFNNIWNIILPQSRIVTSGLTGSLFTQAAAGSITPTGALTTKTTFVQALAGSITATGALIKKTSKSVDGSIAATGNVLKNISKSFAGSITPTGSLGSSIVNLTVAAAGSITATGALTLKILKKVSGSITTSGTVTRATSISVEGSITPTGNTTKKSGQTVSGSITPTGSLTASDPFVPAPDEGGGGLTDGSLAQRIRRIYGKFRRSGFR